MPSADYKIVEIIENIIVLNLRFKTGVAVGVTFNLKSDKTVFRYGENIRTRRVYRRLLKGTVFAISAVEVVKESLSDFRVKHWSSFRFLL